VPLRVNGYLTRGHVAIITETESTYVMIKSTLRFGDVEDVPGLLPLLWAVQGHVCGQENGVGDGLGTRLGHCHFHIMYYICGNPMTTCLHSCTDVETLW